MSLDSYDRLVFHAMLAGQTVFLLMWGMLPWWREWIGRALMAKSVALWLVLLAAVVFMHVEPPTWARVLFAGCYTLMLISIVLQPAALLRELVLARREDRGITGTIHEPVDSRTDST